MSTKYAVHTPTQEDYDTLMRAYEKKGWKWIDGDKPTIGFCWSEYKLETVVGFHNNFRCSSREKQRTFCYTIITLNQALTMLNEPRTLETLQVGDYVQRPDGYFRRILTAQGEGEYRTYGISKYTRVLGSFSLKKHALSFTVFELKEEGYIPYTPEPKPETITVNGKTYRTDEVTECLKELKAIGE